MTRISAPSADFFGPVDRADIQVQRLAIVLGKVAAVLRRRTEHAHLVERAHGAHGFELAAGLKSRPEQSKHLRVRPREIFGRNTARRTDAGALHETVIDDAQKLPRIGREQQNLAVVAPARLRQRELHAARRAVDHRARHDVRIEPDRGDARLGPGARHRLQIVDSALARNRHDRVLSRNVDRIVGAEIGERRLDCRDAIWHLQQGFDIFVGEQDHRLVRAESAGP